MASNTEKGIQCDTVKKLYLMLFLVLFMIAGDRSNTQDLYAIGIIKQLSAACAAKTTIWIQLGLELSLDQTDLDIIQANNPQDVERCCLGMFNLWLNKQPNASWETLRKTLVYVELENLASLIRQPLSPHTFSDSTTDASNVDIGKKLFNILILPSYYIVRPSLMYCLFPVPMFSINRWSKGDYSALLLIICYVSKPVQSVFI